MPDDILAGGPRALYVKHRHAAPMIFSHETDFLARRGQPRISPFCTRYPARNDSADISFVDLATCEIVYTDR